MGGYVLDKISKLCEPVYSTIRDKAKSLYALMVGKPSFDNTTSKLSEKKSEEHLVLLSSKARVSDSPDAPATKGFSGDLGTQNVPKSTPESRCVKLESDEEWMNSLNYKTIPLPILRTKNLFLLKKEKLSITVKGLWAKLLTKLNRRYLKA